MATSSDGPLRLPLAGSIDARDYTGSTDALIINGYIDKDEEGEIRINKRYGFGQNSYDTAVNVTAAPFGCFWWSDRLSLYTITSDGLLRENATTTVASGADFTQGPWWFNQTLGTPSYMYLSNGHVGYTVTSAGVVAKIVDVNYPATTVPGSAYLDGTLYVMDPQARIWGTSALNNPTGWSALNVIVAQVEPDKGVALAKQLVYVVAFKQWTTEFFYDSGNPGQTQGTSLLPVQNAKIPMGCPAPLSVQSINDSLYFVGSNRTLRPAVYVISGLKIDKISDMAVDRILGGVGTVPIVSGYTITSDQFSMNGHSYYVLRVTSYTNTPHITSTISTMVYDIGMKLWYDWNSFAVNQGATGTSVALPLVNMTSNVYTQTMFSQCAIVGQPGAIMTFGLPNGQNPPLYLDQIPTGAFTFTSVPVVIDDICPNFTGGTKRKKMLSKMFLHADQKQGGTLKVRWSDDDYQSWSNWMSVTLNVSSPQLTQLGTFKKRAFHFRHETPGPFRMSEPELQISLGSI